MKKSVTIQSLLILILSFWAFNGLAQWDGTNLTPMPTPRGGGSAVTVDGKIYVIGGIDYDGLPTLRTVEIYDPSENTWTTSTDLPVPLFRPASVVYSGKIYIFGGAFPEGISDMVFEFDPENPDSWTEKATMPSPLDWHEAQVVEDSIYLLGGLNNTWVDSTLVYLPKTDEWIIRAGTPQPRGFYASAVYEDTIYVMGGIYFGLTHNQVYAYNPQSNSWVQKGNMPDSKLSAGSIVHDDHIYLFGGWWSFNLFDLPGDFSPQTWKFHPASDTWENMDADLPDDEVVGFATALGEDPDGNTCIYAFGGALPEFWGGPAGYVTDRVLKLNLSTVSVDRIDKANNSLILHANYPNPFDESTSIGYEIGTDSRVQIQILDVSGRIMETVLDEYQMPGKHEVVWDASGMAPGIYVYRIQTELGSLTGRCILQK